MKHKLVLLLALCVAAFSLAAEEITPESVLRLMNDYRAERGLAPLHEDVNLMRAARDRMRDMEDGGWWSHESPEGVSPFVWLAARDYPYAFAGENLACGFETAGLLVESWMESPGHRANILGTQYSDCGIAIIEGSTKGPAAGKSVVVMFGKRR
ncbi:MAG TPA: CAP domain-containing protein [Thermoanaerobaculia bacterium]|nr:CAP domain-containing protein [Thermoanaerobaculia bacterium]